MTENSIEVAEPFQDAEWTIRYRRRLRAAMEELAKQTQPVPIQEVQDLSAARVPLNDYDMSVTKSGAVRAWNNLGWILTTSFEHAGWLHATQDGGFRATREGAEPSVEHADRAGPVRRRRPCGTATGTRSGRRP